MMNTFLHIQEVTTIIRMTTIMIGIMIGVTTTIMGTSIITPPPTVTAATIITALATIGVGQVFGQASLIFGTDCGVG